MQDAAKPLGSEMVEREQRLDAAFREGTVTPAHLKRGTEVIGILQIGCEPSTSRPLSRCNTC